MSSLSQADKKYLESALRLYEGAVVFGAFSEQEFVDFFADGFNIDIDNPKYCANGLSQVARLQSFLHLEGNMTVGRVLVDLSGYLRNKELAGHIYKHLGFSEGVSKIGEKLMAMPCPQNVMINQQEQVIMENKIPLSIIGLLARIMENYYTHSRLSSLIMSCDFDANLVSGTKLERIQETLGAVNKIYANPIGFLGSFISEIMDREDEWSLKDRESIRKALAKYGAFYFRGKIVPLNGESCVLTEEEQTFLSVDFSNVLFASEEQSYNDAINQRLDEIRKGMSNEMPLSVVFMVGSTLEGILMTLAQQHPQEFNTTAQSPKRNGNVLPFSEWTLTNLIDVAHALGYLREDVKKFAVALRDFRNYIHPREQALAGFNPDAHTARICMNVLMATIDNLNHRRLINE